MVHKLGGFLVVFVAGCGIVPGLSCTEIGCESRLTIDVTELAPLDRDIDVTVDVGGELLQCAGTIDPVDGLSCGHVQIAPSQGGFTITVMSAAEEAADVHLRIAWDGEIAFDEDVAVSWDEPFSPNGKACEPTCISGEAAISLPAPACTLLGCTSELTIDVTDPAPLDRDIDVTVDVGGELLQCAGAIDPVDGLSCGDVRIAASEGGFTIVVNPAAEEAVNVHLRLAWDGEVAFDEDLAVSWDEPFSPNGEACEPTCISGDAAIALEG